MVRTIHLHRPVNVVFAPIDDLIGVANIKAVLPSENGGPPEEIPLNGLAFTDPDGETHIYVMADEERQIAIRQLTGGIILPGQ